MNDKIVSRLRIPSLLLAAALQTLPIVRAALPAAESAGNLFAIIFRWGALAATALGGVQAVSGASTVITTGALTATNGVASTNKLLTAPEVAGWWSAGNLPPGISLIGSGSSWKLAGTPSATGPYSVVLVAKSSASANASETTTKTIVFTVVAGANSPPVANAQSVTTTANTPKAITLTGSDPDGNTLTYAVVTPPANGNLTGTPPNVTYTPTSGYSGGDTFTFRVNDGTTNSAPATVTITVTAPVNVNVQLTMPTRLPNGHELITGTGEASVTYTVLAATALGTWQAIGTATADGAGAFQYEDVDAASFNARFYRVVKP